MILYLCSIYYCFKLIVEYNQISQFINDIHGFLMISIVMEPKVNVPNGPNGPIMTDFHPLKTVCLYHLTQDESCFRL